MFPESTLRKIYSHPQFSKCITDASGTFLICSCNPKNLPTFEFTTSGLRFNITPSMYLLKASVLFDRCYVLMGSLSNTMPFAILGDVFMMNYVTIFDKKSNTVGIHGYK